MLDARRTRSLSDQIVLNSDDEEIKGRLIYKHKSYNIELHTDCLKCLKPGQYIKDDFVQIYLAYLMGYLVQDSDLQRIYIFDSFIYNQLKSIFGSKEIDGQKLRQIHKWYDKVDIFEKDFLVFPICEDDHWFAIVICYAWRVDPVFEDDENIQDSDKDPARRRCKPGLIVMDSLGLKAKAATSIIRDFLDFEWRTRTDRELKRFAHSDLQEYYPPLPKQRNAYDCGIYMLMYLRAFLKQPDKFNKLIKKNDPESVEKLKEEINETIDKYDRQRLQRLILDICHVEQEND